MSFNLQSLKQKAQTRVFSEIRKSQGSTVNAEKLIKENNIERIYESKNVEANAFDIFLSHSSKDAEIVLGILEKLKSLGYTVYVDWIDDTQLDRNNINSSTSNTLKIRMNQSKCLLYATTEHSQQSKWMPWELGYMDGRKEKAAIMPIFASESQSSHSYKGQEYLGIYPYCIQSTYQLNPNKEGLWIMENANSSIHFDEWLKGQKPIKKVL